MRKFENPTVEIEKFDITDVITVSGCPTETINECPNETDFLGL